MSNYYITKYLLENWIMHSVGPVGGAQWIKEEEDFRRSGKARDERDQCKELLQGQLAEKYSHLITHAIYIYNYLRRRNETTGRKRQ